MAWNTNDSVIADTATKAAAVITLALRELISSSCIIMFLVADLTTLGTA